jgi:2-hydroxychromene-2-carboxylate isomerase
MSSHDGPGAGRRRLDFWFDFASTYSYLSAMRIAEQAEAHGVAVRWRPFLLGPIFKNQGWSTSPFNLYPAKGRYMIRDIERIAASRGIEFRMPESFPAHSVAAARVALVGEDEGWIGGFCKAVFAAEFAAGADISDRAVLARVALSQSLEFSRIHALSEQPENRLRLRQQTERAQALGIFGAPTFVTSDGELFWGDDRLDFAIDWARRL